MHANTDTYLHTHIHIRKKNGWRVCQQYYWTMHSAISHAPGDQSSPRLLPPAHHFLKLLKTGRRRGLWPWGLPGDDEARSAKVVGGELMRTFCPDHCRNEKKEKKESQHWNDENPKENMYKRSSSYRHELSSLADSNRG